jgi:hypothetical protein
MERIRHECRERRGHRCTVATLVCRQPTLRDQACNGRLVEVDRDQYCPVPAPPAKRALPFCR